ncbi:ABC transporter permease [Cloacibacillus porcorum]|uniref:Multidrug ABC transporter substrate-binding protein n=2 Tax=Cloacibacillus porcorum TaxID=1197717 RepID=A0A1B2I6E6_9BACT|nr:ABC transporter permease [Cloacibacillus porcorum]ANZ45551.1 multidrug ABC transporter substrate-binding protein [Cloacibacillus porcorum]MCI5865182.1 ABC transporter permease [Cloacibacillus porcorum]MDY5388929.1 ABC transporter permease [Cloacibacillus porcorum]NMF18396.1 FtsX-like permease family protein [Cloacibacillus porcorum]
MIAISEVFSASLTALRRNKTRSMLTALGIIIGVAAVIAAFAVGAGANKSIDEQISSFGSNFIMVFPDRPGRSTTGVTRYLTYDDAQAIEKEVSGVDAVAPMINLSATLVYENTNWSSSVVGSTKEYSYVQEWNIESGRDINASDVRQGAKVAVIGKTVVDKLFGGENPVGKAIRINKIPFTVVGVFEAKGLSAMGSDQDDFILVPLTSAQRRLVRWKTAGRIGNIYIKGVSMEALSYIQNETEALLRERHKIKPGDADDFAVRNVSQMLEARRKTTTIMSMLLGSIAFISLVVGGIGIMNIMLVSVTERTREIGIRMAVGATERDIRMQFLIEAVVLSMIGGTIGIMLGVAAGYALSSFTSAPPVFTLMSIVLAFVFSAMVGVGFGYYPAYKASLLNPIDALKYE